MNSRFEAAWEIHQFLQKHNITYAIIGGIAVHSWGDQRFTKDVDLTIAASLEVRKQTPCQANYFQFSIPRW